VGAARPRGMRAGRATDGSGAGRLRRQVDEFDVSGSI
jgi:hypothetical protein